MTTKERPNRARCPECTHPWSQHDAWGCQVEDGCLRIDRHTRFDKANKVAVPVVEGAP